MQFRVQEIRVGHSTVKINHMQLKVDNAFSTNTIDFIKIEVLWWKECWTKSWLPKCQVTLKILADTKFVSHKYNWHSWDIMSQFKNPLHKMGLVSDYVCLELYHITAPKDKYKMLCDSNTTMQAPPEARPKRRITTLAYLKDFIN